MRFYWWGPPDRQFMGSIFGAYDAPAYLQAITDAIHGQWVVWATRTAHGYQGGMVFYTPYTLLGRALGWTGLPPETIFLAGRWVSTAAALAAAWLFVRAALPPAERTFGYFGGVLAGGLGFLVLSRPETPLGIVLPLDIAGPSFTVANGLLMGPHVILAMAGLAIFGWGLLAASQGVWRGLWGATGLAFVASFHAFVVPTALLAGTAFVVWRARSRQAVAVLAAAYLLSAPFMLYAAWLLLHDPGVKAWEQIGAVEVENLPSLLISRAALWPLIGIGAWLAWREASRPGLGLALCWGASALFFDLAPFFATNSLHRSVEGSSLAFGVLAAAGAARVPLRVRAGLVGLASISPVLLAVAILAPIDPDQLMARSDYQAMVWLRQTGSHEQVLAHPQTLRWLLGLTSVRADPAAGDPNAAHLKIDVVKSRDTNPGWVEKLTDGGTTLLFWGEREQARDGPPPEGFRMVFRSGATSVLGLPSG